MTPPESALSPPSSPRRRPAAAAVLSALSAVRRRLRRRCLRIRGDALRADGDADGSASASGSGWARAAAAAGGGLRLCRCRRTRAAAPTAGRDRRRARARARARRRRPLRLPRSCSSTDGRRDGSAAASASCRCRANASSCATAVEPSLGLRIRIRHPAAAALPPLLANAISCADSGSSGVSDGSAALGGRRRRLAPTSSSTVRGGRRRSRARREHGRTARPPRRDGDGRGERLRGQSAPIEAEKNGWRAPARRRCRSQARRRVAQEGADGGAQVRARVDRRRVGERALGVDDGAEMAVGASGASLPSASIPRRHAADQLAEQHAHPHQCAQSWPSAAPPPARTPRSAHGEQPLVGADALREPEVDELRIAGGRGQRSPP